MGGIVLDWLMASLAVLWVPIVGFGWARALRPSSHWTEQFGLASLLGLAIVVAAMLGWQLAGLRYALTPLLGISGLVGLAAVFFNQRGSTSVETPPRDTSRAVRVLNMFLGALVGFLVLVDRKSTRLNSSH